MQELQELALRVVMGPHGASLTLWEGRDPPRYRTGTPEQIIALARLLLDALACAASAQREERCGG